LQYDRDLQSRKSLFIQILHEVLEAFDIFIFLYFERVGDEDHSVNSPQNKFSCSVIHDLARNGVELDADGHVEDFADIER
jgi:hypothetical protein